MSAEVLLNDAAHEAERALIGAALLNENFASRVGVDVKPEDFTSKVHAAIWEAVATLARKGQEVNIITVRDTIPAKKLQALGGVQYLAQLIEETPSATSESGHAYAKVVLQHAARRTLRSRAEALLAACDSTDIESLLGSAGTLADGLHVGAPPVVDAADVVAELSKAEAITGLSTGIREIDELRLGGLPKAEVAVFGGETGSGKTLLGTQIACHDLRHNRNVLFVSLEMTASQLVSRLMKQLSGYWSESHASSQGNVQAWRDAVVILNQGRLMVYDSSMASNPSAESILDWMQDEHERFPVDRVIVDYAQKLTLRDGGRLETYESHRRISEMFRRFAKKHGIALLMLSQINRNGNDLSLRGSREYENDSALTLMMVKDNDRDASPDDRKMAIVKNRHGACKQWSARVNGANLCLEAY